MSFVYRRLQVLQHCGIDFAWPDVDCSFRFRAILGQWLEYGAIHSGLFQRFFTFKVLLGDTLAAYLALTVHNDELTIVVKESWSSLNLMISIDLVIVLALDQVRDGELV